MSHKTVQPCTEWAEKLAFTRLEDLPQEDVDRLLEHLEVCPACSATRLEYCMMDTLIRNYPHEKAIRSQPKSLPMPEFEFHRLRLLLQRQMKRRHGIILVLTSSLIFILTLSFLVSLHIQHQTGISMPLLAVVGLFTPMYTLWEGLHAIVVSLQPVSFEEVKQRRSKVRAKYFIQENQSKWFKRKRWRSFGIRNIGIVSGMTLLIFAVSMLSLLKWVYFLVSGGSFFLAECLLILDTLFVDEEKEGIFSEQEKQSIPQAMLNGELAENMLLEQQTDEM